MLDRFRVPDGIAVRVPPETMKAAVRRIFEALGSPADDAERCAETLLYADRRGIDSHGVSNMMRAYVAGIRGGAINPAPRSRAHAAEWPVISGQWLATPPTGH